MSNPLRWKAVFHALIGSYLNQERGRTALTVLGVALGVAVLVAIDLANESAVASFKNTLNDVAGRAVLTVRGNGQGLDGSMVRELREFEEISSISPLIQGNAIWRPADDRAPETLLLFGIDMLFSEERDEVQVRDIRFRLEQDRDPTSFFSRSDALIFTERFLLKAGLELGDQVELEIGGITQTFTVGGVLDAGDLTNTYDGNVLITDIGIADILLRRNGLVDRMDLTVVEGTDVDALAERLEAWLPPSALVERPERRGSQVDEMLAAFRFNLRALGQISILVGAFLIFNTMSVAVVRRRTAIGTLRAMGVSRGAIRGVFLLEGALLGLVGSILGMIGGTVLAVSLLGVVSDAISINFFQTTARTLAPSAGIYAMALAMGVGGSVLAALKPANEAATTPPANTMRRGSVEAAGSSLTSSLVIGAVLAGLGVVALLVRPGFRIPLSGYVASIFFLAAFVWWSRPVLALCTMVLRGVYTRLFGAEGLLAISSTQASLGRASVAICGLMISVGMAVSVSVMVSSFRDTVTTWMGQVLVADLYVTVATDRPTERPEGMPDTISSKIAAIPGVEAVDPFRMKRLVINGRPAFLGAGSLSVVRFENNAVDGRPMPEVLKEALANEELIVSESFARKHGYKAGDVIDIPTPRGIKPMRINALTYDYSSEQGYAIMDRAVFLRYFDDPLIDSVAVYLEPDADRAEVRRQINAAAASLADHPPITMREDSDIRALALTAFDRTFAITYLLQLIAVIVAVLGVATTLLSQILDRRHEIVTLRYIGASQARVARIVVLESGLIGVAGLALGIVSGLLLSWILTRVIMLESFGWTIQFGIPWLVVAQIAGIVFLATVIAAIFPARQAAKFSGRLVQTMAG